MMINPTDIHDPIVQIFAGEEIDMDKFQSSASPDTARQVFNVAHNPFAATQFFYFIINVVLNTLFAIKATPDRVHSDMGLLGKVSAYFGIVKAQGQGSLHVHMLLWLQGTPDIETMHHLLDTVQFCKHVKEYINFNIQANVAGLDRSTVTHKTGAMFYCFLLF